MKKHYVVKLEIVGTLDEINERIAYYLNQHKKAKRKRNGSVRTDSSMFELDIRELKKGTKFKSYETEMVCTKKTDTVLYAQDASYVGSSHQMSVGI